ncbi:Fur family transcriptional regulator [Nocardioides sp.]|uniref:Fur family transcriptional regulator n=1 Tax=Nocardioides sp. TaxID=35761 RepID=UPI003519C7F7
MSSAPSTTDAATAGTTGPRSTRQKRAVDEVLARAVGFLTAQELHAVLRDEGQQVGLATVYRILQGAAEAGLVDVVKTEAGEAAYRRCRTEHHHHHLLCRSCGRSVEIEGPAVEDWAHSVAREHGFVEVAHTVELIGLCPDCARA